MILLSFCSACTWSILPFLLGAWLLGWLFWWLFNKSRYQAQIEELEGNINSWKNKSNQLEKDIAEAKYERQKLVDEHSSLRAKYNDTVIRLKACEEQKVEPATAAPIPPPNPLSGVEPKEEKLTHNLLSSAAPQAPRRGQKLSFGAAFKNDNLQIVEGIGPKIAQLLKDNGIDTWVKLGASNKEQLKEILSSAGSRYRIHDPSTWPEQAKMAESGEWEKLRDYQAFLGGGKDTGKVGGGDAKIEKMAAKILGVVLYKPNDLKVVEGIGPKIEKLLKDGGIQSWSDLATSTVDRIQRILKAAGDRYRLANPSTWPKQAQLALDGQWEELGEYQDRLKGGKE